MDDRAVPMQEKFRSDRDAFPMSALSLERTGHEHAYSGVCDYSGGAGLDGSLDEFDAAYSHASHSCVPSP